MGIFKTYFLLVIVLLSVQSCNTNETSLAKIIPENNSSVINKTSQLKGKIFADTSYLEDLYRQYDLVNIKSLDTSIHINLKYSDTNNFIHKNLYDGLRKAYLPCEVANHLCNAQFYLKQINPDYSLIIFDAVRPFHIQKYMWDSLKIEPNLKYNYLAPPFEESLHNYGCAVDVSIMDISTNTILDMGSPFDSFQKLSQPVYEFQFLKTCELTKEAVENRKLLRKVMHFGNFYGITSEWWHFNYCTKEQAVLRFKLIK
ncbi:MAG: M15 family metallopeptidase [Bacteroidota bacterium]|nr:M15 family metallopeptidase [Bacteroidota bacterium]